MKFEIKKRFSGDVMFSCELIAEIAVKSYGLQLGFAVKKAIEAGADLARANLAGANNVPETNGSDAANAEEPGDRAERQGQRAAKFRERFPDVPVVDQLDAKILAAVESGAGRLDMSAWHTCKTTHCRAGWAVALAGNAGQALESRYGTEDAGRRIYLASAGRCPWFFDSNERALADIRAQAALLGGAS